MPYFRICSAFLILMGVVAATDFVLATPTPTPAPSKPDGAVTTANPRPPGVNPPHKVRPDGAGNVLDGGTKQPGSAAEKSTDLRAKVARIRRRDGRLTVHQASDHRVIAQIKGNKIVGWSATDAGGKPLPTQVTAKGVYCRVCIATPDGKATCYEIDCDDAPMPKPTEKPPAKQ